MKKQILILLFLCLCSVTCWGALYFDGIDDYVKTVSSIGISGNVDLSIQFWVKHIYVDVYANWVSVGGPYAADKMVAIQGHSTNSIAINYWGGADGRNIVTPRHLTVWNNIAYTYNSKTLADAVYFNGVLISTRTVTTKTWSDYTVRIGGYPGGWIGTQQMKGWIADVRIFNCVLTKAEIQSNMYRTSLVDSRYIGYWKINDGAGSRICDYSGKGNHGTFGTSAVPVWVTDNPPIMTNNMNIQQEGKLNILKMDYWLVKLINDICKTDF